MSRIPQDKLNDLEKRIIQLIQHCKNHMINASQLFVILQDFKDIDLNFIADDAIQSLIEIWLQKVPRSNSHTPLEGHLHTIHGMVYNGLLSLTDPGYNKPKIIESHRRSEVHIHLTPTAKAYAENLSQGRDPALWYPSRKIFIACSFGEYSDDVRRLVENQFKVVIAKYDFETVIMSDESAEMSIDEKIIEHIRTSYAMIADLTYARQSVYYEVGYAKALGMPTVLTCRQDHRNSIEDMSKVHFDLDHHTLSLWKEINTNSFTWSQIDFDDHFKKALRIQ